MGVFIYADESGVLDRSSKYFTFGGVVLLDSAENGVARRLYNNAEEHIRDQYSIALEHEVKAVAISPQARQKLFRATASFYRFCVVIDQEKLNDRIFKHKKSRQRYLDFAFKVGLKRFLLHLCRLGQFSREYSDKLCVYFDQHSTATNGRYELEEGLEQEFVIGTVNYESNRFFPPVFPRLGGVRVKFVDSRSNILVRASDIVANRAYYLANAGRLPDLQASMFTTLLP